MVYTVEQMDDWGKWRNCDNGNLPDLPIGPELERLLCKCPATLSTEPDIGPLECYVYPAVSMNLVHNPVSDETLSRLKAHGNNFRFMGVVTLRLLMDWRNDLTRNGFAEPEHLEDVLSILNRCAVETDDRLPSQFRIVFQSDGAI